MLIPDVVDLNCKTNPSGPFYVYAKPDSSEIVTITHLEFSRASHRAANILRPNGEGPAGQVVALVALSDTVLYHAVLVGLITANFIVRVSFPFKTYLTGVKTALSYFAEEFCCWSLPAAAQRILPSDHSHLCHTWISLDRTQEAYR